MGTGELLGKPNILRGSDLRWTYTRPGEVEILLAASCFKSGISSGSHEPDGSKASLSTSFGPIACFVWGSGCVTLGYDRV